MITSTEIRAIVRAELRRFLLHAADSFPPEPSPPSGPPDGLAAVLDAWERLSEGQPRGLTVGDARRVGGAAWEALGDALGLGDDDRDVRRVGMALALLAGHVGADGRRLIGGMNRTRKVRRWRVAPGPVRQGVGSAGAGGRWDGYQPVDGPEPPPLA